MGHIDETKLPGIGQRVEFVTEEGRRMGVVQHHSGRREVFVCGPEDPDATRVTVQLSEDDAHSLVESLGVRSIEERADERSYEIEGLVFAWLDVDAASPAVGRSIAEMAIRTHTGASIVAVLRPTGPVPAPEPDFAMQAGDTLVVAGTSDGIQAVRTLLTAT